MRKSPLVSVSLLALLFALAGITLASPSLEGQASYFLSPLPSPTSAHAAYLPLIIQPGVSTPPTATATATMTGTPTPTRSPTPTATSSPCVEALVNGGFEADAGWEIRSNPVLAAYVAAPVHSGSRAMRTGIEAGGANVESYSPIQQTVVLPAGASAELRFWRYNIWGDGAAGQKAGPVPALDRLPRVEADLGSEPLGADFFYAIAIRPDGSIVWLLVERVDAPSWRQAGPIDLSALAGQTIRLQFGTYNNGSGGISRTVDDDASLQICAGGATATPTPTPTRTATPTSSATPTKTATPTATPTQTPAGFPAIVRDLVVAPGSPGPLYALTNSQLLLRSDDRGATWYPAPQGVPAAVGRAGLGMDYANPSTLYLGTLAGLFRTSGGAPWQFVHTVHTHALSVEYGRPNTLWAAVSQPHDFGSGVFVIKSDDGGQIWRSASLGLGGWTAGSPIIIDPDDPNRLFVMAFTKYGGGLLYRGAGAGIWQWLHQPADSYLINGGLAFDNGSNALLLGSRYPGRLWRSINANTPNPNDVAWQVVHDFGQNASVQPLAVGWGPNGPALYVNLTDTTTWNTQLLRSDDGGATWTTLALPPGPPPPPQNQYQLVVNGYPAIRQIADRRTQDRYATSFAGLHRRIGYGDWILASGNASPRPEFVFSPANSNIIWAGLIPGCLAGGPDEPMFKSVDGGRTWAEAPAGRNLQPVAAHPTDPFKVYAFGCDGPYLTVDGGAIWQRQDSPLWLVYQVSDIAPLDPGWNVVYASGISEGGGGMVARSNDGGATWTQVTPLTEDIWWITDVWIDPTNANRVYFLEPKGVWRSDDGGASWQRFTAGLEDVLWQDGRELYGLREIVSRTDDASRLYLGTAAGLYEGFNYGQSWQKLAGYAWDAQAVDGLLADPSGVWLNSPDGAFYVYRGYATPTPTPTATP